MTEDEARRRNRRIVKNLHWDEKAHGWLDTWGITQADAEAIVLADLKPSLDPHSTEVGHPIARFKRGDVIVVVGFRDKDRPQVLSVFVNTPDDIRIKNRAPGAGPGTSLPTSIRQMKGWIIDYGYKLEFARNGHLQVVDRESGQMICQLAATPSDHRTIANDWRRFLREHAKHVAEKKRLQQ
jgi:hypothetical protein